MHTWDRPVNFGICFCAGGENSFFTVKSTQLFLTETTTSSAKPRRIDFYTPSISANFSPFARPLPYSARDHRGEALCMDGAPAGALPPKLLHTDM